MTAPPSRRGFGLIITLLWLSLLVVMVCALFLVVREKMFQSQTYHDQIAALYMAELALVDAMTELERDAYWTDGFDGKTLPGVAGRYSVTFSGTRGKEMESVNNVSGSSPDSYHGMATVPRGHCLLVATGEVGKISRTVEALVDMGGGLMVGVDRPIMIDGKALLREYAIVEGVKSLKSPEPIPAGIHSNSVIAAPDLVVVDGTSLITGKVSCSSPEPGAVNLGGYLPAGGTEEGAAQKTVANVPIIATVGSHLGGSPIPAAAPNPPPPGYGPLPLLGTIRLTHAGGPEFSHSGNLTLTGDLELAGATLYVDGDLNVNGSITGEGSVWVSGETRLHGTAKITTSTPDRVALFSHGGVTLKGFEGGAAMTDYGLADSRIAQSWDTVKSAMSAYPATLGRVVSTADLGSDSEMDSDTGPRSRIGSGQNYPLTALQGAAGNLTVRSLPRHNDSLPGDSLLLGMPASSGRDFLIRRLFGLYALNFGSQDGGPDELMARAEAQAGRLGLGGVDAINDHYLLDRLPLVSSMLEGFDIDHPGQAMFQGQIYTHGYFVATGQVSVIGCVVTSLDPANPTLPTVVNGRTANPGDCLMLGGSRILFVEDFFKPRRVRTPSDHGAGVLWCNIR